MLSEYIDIYSLCVDIQVESICITCAGDLYLHIYVNNMHM